MARLSEDRRSLPVTRGQAYNLARAWNLCGFGSFVPGWTEPGDNEDAGTKAARLLTESGCNRGTASDAITFLKEGQKGARTTVQKENRRIRGAAILFGMAKPSGKSKTQPKEADSRPAAGQLTPEQLAEQLRKLEEQG
jgi:hypothetical protein